MGRYMITYIYKLNNKKVSGCLPQRFWGSFITSEWELTNVETLNLNFYQSISQSVADDR